MQYGIAHYTARLPLPLGKCSFWPFSYVQFLATSKLFCQLALVFPRAFMDIMGCPASGQFGMVCWGDRAGQVSAEMVSLEALATILQFLKAGGMRLAIAAGRAILASLS